MLKHHIDKAILLALLLVALVLVQSSYMSITGYNTASVSVKEKTQGAILMNYDRNVNLTETQTITAEFVNTGTNNFTSRIEITVYLYNNDTNNLEQLATYYDGYVTLFSGERKSFTANFLPTKIGTYYIKVRVPYEYKVTEAWGSFFVTWTWPQVQEIIFVSTSQGGGIIQGQREYGTTEMELSYNSSLDIYPGQSMMFPIFIRNTGTINLHNVKLYSTTTENIGFDVNPKVVYELRQNKSAMFLVSINVSENIQPGDYEFAFDVMGEEIKRSGIVKLSVGSFNVSIEDEVRDAILNYEYLINEAERETYLARLEGFNTTRAEGYLEDAKLSLGRARELFDQGDYEGSRDALDSVKKNLEKVVLDLATISIKLYTYPAFSPFLILLLIIIIIIVIIIIAILERRKKNRKPKLIRDYNEEEG
jgi:hypothetical protein